MHLTRRTFLGTGLAFAAAPAAAGTAVTGGPAFGSYWRLTAPEGAPLGPATAAITRIVARIDAALSPWQAGSEVSRFNAAPEGLDGSRDFRDVAALALGIARETGGAFDPTVGPLVARYGFGPIFAARPGTWEALDLDGGRLTKTAPGLSFDPCGIAKGHALDLMRAALVQAGLPDFLLELGGEVAARGRHPDGRAWRVALDGAPVALALPGGAAATSGRLAQSYEVAGRTYTHIVDPGTGAPVAGDVLSVTVFGADAGRADALATALYAAAEHGPELADRLGLDALFLVADGPAPRLLATGGAGDRILG